MAYFAEIDEANLVVRVLAVDDRDTVDAGGNEVGSIGAEYLTEGFGGAWVQTSYNTLAGVHASGGTPFRKNYAGPGYEWREDLDGFVPPRPYDSWHLEPATCQWEPPIPRPEDVDKNKRYVWDEGNLEWVEIARVNE